MIYKIIVDKQPMTNPSAEKKEYEVDIEELRFKHDVYDSLVITKGEDYVMRRLELQDYNVLVELNPPRKEPLTNINIELFEGDNYIYLYDMAGNKIVAQYLIENEFNDLYVLDSEMHSAIRQSADEIELVVGGTTTNLSGAVNEINGELALKVGRNENNQIVSMLNASADEITLAGGSSIKLSSAGKLIISAGNFKLDSSGNIDAQGGTIDASKVNVTNINANNITSGTISGSKINGGTINGNNVTITNLNASNIKSGKIQVSGYSSTSGFIEVGRFDLSYPNGPYGTRLWDNGITVSNMASDISQRIPIIRTESADGYAELKNDVVNAFGFNNVSLAEKKKDFELLKSGLAIIKDIDIYKYNYKNEENKKKHIGIVIGDKFNYSKEVTSDNNEEIDIYSFVSVCCKAIQEQQEEIEELKSRIEKLEKGE